MLMLILKILINFEIKYAININNIESTIILLMFNILSIL